MRDQTLTKTDPFAIKDILDDVIITEATKETLRRFCTIGFENDGFIFPEDPFGNDRFETQHIPSSTRNDDDDDGIRDLSQESINGTIEARQDGNDKDRDDDEILSIGVRQSSCSLETKPQQQYINHIIDEARDDRDGDDHETEDSDDEMVFLGTYRPSPHDPRNNRDAIFRPRAVKKAADLLDDMGQITQNTECHHHHHQQRRQLHERPMDVVSSRPWKRRRITDDSECPVVMEQPSLKELENDLLDLFGLLDEEQHRRHVGETDEQATNDLNDVNGHFIFEPSSILTRDDDLGISDDGMKEAFFLLLQSCSWANEA